MVEEIAPARHLFRRNMLITMEMAVLPGEAVLHACPAEKAAPPTDFIDSDQPNDAPAAHMS